MVTMGPVLEGVWGLPDQETEMPQLSSRVLHTVLPAEEVFLWELFVLEQV